MHIIKKCTWGKEPQADLQLDVQNVFHSAEPYTALQGGEVQMAGKFKVQFLQITQKKKDNNPTGRSMEMIIWKQAFKKKGTVGGISAQINHCKAGSSDSLLTG